MNEGAFNMEKNTSYPLLEAINSPEDLKALPEEKIDELCREIRAFLIDSAEKNGGHLASNLGVVELSLALHRVFSSPKDHIIFDVGHQSYVHKLITGRREAFETLRTPGGLSGFTKREESQHDPFGAGHSSTSISASLGFAEADLLQKRNAHTVCIIGDGAYTGGMAHEALNNVREDLPLVIILNENGMSISTNKGSFAGYLSKVRLSSKYQKLKGGTKRFVLKLPLVGKPIKRFLTYIKRKIKNLFLQENYFEELGLHYIGPIDGNDYERVRDALRVAKDFGKTVVVHLVTKKGAGYLPAEKFPSTYHSISSSPQKNSFHSELSPILSSLAQKDKSIVAVTAAMGIGTGLESFGARFPERYFDVGIAEAHALTFAAGLSSAGLSPYVAIYSTFLQRGYDSILHDIALQRLPVKLLIDRAGLSLGDGATHHGIFDVSMLLSIPSISLFAPLSFRSLKRCLTYSVKSDLPIAIRYPNTAESELIKERLSYLSEEDESLILSDFRVENIPDHLFVSYGQITERAILAADLLRRRGINAGVIALEVLKPYSLTFDKLLPIFEKAERILLVEEGIKQGGFCELLLSYLSERIDLSRGKYRIAAIDDNFASPSAPVDLYDYVGLSEGRLVDRMLE